MGIWNLRRHVWQTAPNQRRSQAGHDSYKFERE